MLAHLVFWHEIYVRVISDLLRGKHPRLLTGSFRELNALAASRYAGLPVAGLVERLLAAQAELERLTGRSDAGRLRLWIKEGSAPCPLDEFLDRVEAHSRRHEAQLKRLTRRKEEIERENRR